VKLIASIHENVLLNVEQAQKKQKKTYEGRKGKQTFEGLVAGENNGENEETRKEESFGCKLGRSVLIH
jgi:hypothetical protein